jgi:hypothetical protein
MTGNWIIEHKMTHKHNVQHKKMSEYVYVGVYKRRCIFGEWNEKKKWILSAKRTKEKCNDDDASIVWSKLLWILLRKNSAASDERTSEQRRKTLFHVAMLRNVH